MRTNESNNNNTNTTNKNTFYVILLGGDTNVCGDQQNIWANNRSRSENNNLEKWVNATKTARKKYDAKSWGVEISVYMSTNNYLWYHKNMYAQQCLSNWVGGFYKLVNSMMRCVLCVYHSPPSHITSSSLVVVCRFM